MTIILLGIEASELKIWFPNRNPGNHTKNSLWKETAWPKESSALETLHCKLKEINSEKQSSVCFTLYDGSLKRDNIRWESVRLSFIRGLLRGALPSATTPSRSSLTTVLDLCLVPRGHQTFIHLISCCQQPLSQLWALLKGGHSRLTVVTVDEQITQWI